MENFSNLVNASIFISKEYKFNDVLVNYCAQYNDYILDYAFYLSMFLLSILFRTILSYFEGHELFIYFKDSYMVFDFAIIFRIVILSYIEGLRHGFNIWLQLIFCVILAFSFIRGVLYVKKYYSK